MVEASLDIAYGTSTELERAGSAYEAEMPGLIEQGATILHPAGAPPLLLGYEGEAKLVHRWEKRFGMPVFTNGMSQVNALRAFGAKRIVGATYFRGPVNERFRQYYAEAGFEVLAMAHLDVDFQAVTELTSEEIDAFFSSAVAGHPDADALYLLGPAWRRSLDLIETLERRFGIPIIHHVPAQTWEIQRRLGMRRPRGGYGRLLAEFPA